MSRLLLICLGLMLAGAANAQSPRTNLGTLTCTLGEEGQKQGTPAGEERAMRCAFKPSNSGVEQTYSGLIRRVGQNGLPAGKQVMIWVVQGPAETKLEPGLLAQTYVGGREQTPGQRATGQTLVGERNSDIQMRAETPTDSEPARVVVTVMELKILTVPA